MLLDSKDEIKRMNLYDVINKRAKEHPNRYAIQLEKTKLTWRELLKQIDHFSSGLVKMGIKKGDKFGICLPNSIQAVVAIYALNKIGACAVLFNPLENIETIGKQITITNCSYFLFCEVSAKKVVELINNGYSFKPVYAKLLPYFPLKLNIAGNIKFKPNKYINILKKQTCVIDFDDIFDTKLMSKLHFETMPNDAAVIIFSGGSTGVPKAVVHTSFSINSSAHGCLLIEEKPNDSTCIIGALPFFHIFGLVVAFHISLSCGSKLILIPMFDAKQVAKIFIEEKPAYFPAVPTMYIKLLKTGILQRAILKGKLDTSNFKRGFIGGDKLPEQIKDEFNKIVKQGGGSGLAVEGYGLTECCPVSVNLKDNYKNGCIGHIFEGTTVKICKKGTIDDLGILTEGEICISSTGLFGEYYNNKSLTKSVVKTHADGKKWFHTGDFGKLDEAGMLHFNCRNHQIIKVSGHAVFLKRIEDIISQQEFIHTAVAIAIPDENKINVIKVYVVIDNKFKNVKQDEILEKLNKIYKQKFNPWEKPKYTVFCEENDIPKTSLGKTAYHLINN